MSRLFLFVVLVTVFSGRSLVAAAEGIDEQLRLLIDSRSTSDSVLSWKFKAWNFRLKPAYEYKRGSVKEDLLAAQKDIDLSSADGMRLALTGQVVFDSALGRFKIELQSDVEWIGGSADTLSRVNARTFDGEVFGTLTQENSKASGGGQRSIAIAEFSKSTPFADEIQGELTASGVSIMPPNLPLISTLASERGSQLKPQEFIDLLEQSVIIGVFGNADRKSVSFTVPTSKEPERFYQYTFALRQGGLLTQLKSGPHKELPHDYEIVVTNTKASRRWLPVSLTSYACVSGFGRKMEFSDYSDPTGEEDQFILDIPKGTVVHDHVQKLSYIAGTSPRDEARELVSYAQTFELAVADVGRARPLTAFWRWPAVILGVLTCIAVFLAFRKVRAVSAVWLLLTLGVTDVAKAL